MRTVNIINPAVLEYLIGDIIPTVTRIHVYIGLLLIQPAYDYLELVTKVLPTIMAL